MAVKDPEVAALLERARRTYKTFKVGDAQLNFGRLTLEDNIQIKEETGLLVLEALILLALLYTYLLLLKG